MRRLIYRFYRLASGTRYRVERRLTRPGLVVLGGSVVLGLLSLDISGSRSYQPFLLLVAFFGGAVAFTWFFRLRFSAERILPRFGSVGIPVQYQVTLRNHGQKTQTGLVLLENLADPRPTLKEFIALQQAEERRMRSFSVKRNPQRWKFELVRVKEVTVPALPPGQAVDVRLELTPLRRGHVRFTGVTIGRPDPFGLMKSFVRQPLPQSLLVLPRRYLIPAVPLPGTMKYQQGGVAMASSVGESEEFVSLREYRPGDPLRHIHWRSWARVGKPVVKEFQDEFFVRHALILDTFTDHPTSDVFEEAVSVAASFACTIQTQESLLDLLFVGPEAYCFTSGRGVGHTEHLLEILASVRICHERGFETLENLVLEHIGAVSGCICVFIAWDQRRRDFVERLHGMGIPLLVLVIAEAGARPAMEVGPIMNRLGQFHVLEIGAIQEGLAKL